VAAALALAACATNPGYGPAERAGALGYSDTRLTEERARVLYMGEGVAEARDLALLRAAEVTLDAGYDWFEVVASDVERLRGGRGGPRVGVGVGGGSGGGVSVGGGVGLSIPVGGGSGERTRAVLEIFMGAGPAPQGADVYDAREVTANLGPAAG
jgi:hypothetical protein